VAPIVLGGCSFAFTHGPPANHAKREVFDCSTSQAPPILDVAMAGFQTFRFIYATTQSDYDYRDFPISRGADIGIGVGLAVLFLSSSIYGYAQISDCEDAKEAYYKRMKRKKKKARPTRPAAPLKPKRQCTNDLECDGTAICINARCAPMPAPASIPRNVKRVKLNPPSKPEPDDTEADSVIESEEAADESEDQSVQPD
jgi:hypothetical protein